jgi:hypothetical protein
MSLTDMQFAAKELEGGGGGRRPPGLFVARAKESARKRCAAVRVDVAVDPAVCKQKKRKTRARARSEQTLHISRDRVKKNRFEFELKKRVFEQPVHEPVSEPRIHHFLKKDRTNEHSSTLDGSSTWSCQDKALNPPNASSL